MRWNKTDDNPPGLISEVVVEPERRLPQNMWDYMPRGPVYTIEYAGCPHAFDVGERPHGAEAYDSLENALRRFVTVAVPVWRDYHWQLLDSARTVVLGYNADRWDRERYGPYGGWVGVKDAFEVLSYFHDPMEVAVWETMAHDRDWTTR